jgi:hypothetical protein
VDLSATRKIACAPPAICRRFTRNKVASFHRVVRFRHNGHDERSQTVLAPSFRHDGRSAISAPALRRGAQAPWARVYLAEPSSSIVRNVGNLQRVSPNRDAGAMSVPRRRPGDLCPEKAFSEMSELSTSERSISRGQCPQVCGELVNRGGAGPS